jgi:hypothetical protein
VRVSVTAVVLGALGALAGGWLVGRWCLGLVLIAEGGCAVFWSLSHDFQPRPARPSATALEQVFDRARAS